MIKGKGVAGNELVGKVRMREEKYTTRGRRGERSFRGEKL